MTVEGWAFPGTGRKAHYFVEGRSLCQKWLQLGIPDEWLQPDEGTSKDDCAGCRRKLNSRVAAPTETKGEA